MDLSSWNKAFSWRAHYERLPVMETDLNQLQNSEKIQPSTRICSLPTISRKVLAVLIIGAFTIVSYLIFSKHAQHKALAHCGTTAEEARSNGCIFEMTGSSWVTPECYDAETEREFLSFKDWHFFKDINYTQEVPLEEVRRGDGPGYFVSHDYHATHCGFLLKKMHRAVNSGRKLDGLIKAFHHTNHCVQWMLDPPKHLKHLPQFAYTKFPYCGKEGGYHVDERAPDGWTN